MAQMSWLILWLMALGDDWTKNRKKSEKDLAVEDGFKGGLHTITFLEKKMMTNTKPAFNFLPFSNYSKT